MEIKAKWQSNEIPLSVFSITPGFLIAGAVLFFALVKTDFSLALPAAGVLLIGLIAGIWIRLASSRISFTMKPDKKRLYPGENLELELELANNKFLPVWVNLELPSPKHLAPGASLGTNGSLVTEGSHDNDVLKTGSRLLSWEKSRRIWRLTAKKRGVSSLGPALISAGDLLGLGSKAKSFSSEHEIVVFPRRLKMLPLHLAFQEYFGMHAAKGYVEDPVWFAGTRDYSGTRPMKNIHWKASARLGVLQEKLFEPTYQRKVLFVFDTESYSVPLVKDDVPVTDISACREKTERDFERMLETLGTLAAALMESGAAFGLVTGASGSQQAGALNAAVLHSGRGPEHLGNFLEMLARTQMPSVTVYDTSERKPSHIIAALREALRAYTGLVYCGACAEEGARDIVREVGAGKKAFFIFSHGTETFFEGSPACLAEEICFAGDAAI